MMKRSGFALAFVFVAASAWAQGATQAPLAKVTVSSDVAKRTLMKMQINAETARAIVDACLEYGRTQQGGPSTYAIYVLAPNGDIVDAHVVICARRNAQPIVTSDPDDLGRLDPAARLLAV